MLALAMLSSWANNVERIDQQERQQETIHFYPHTVMKSSAKTLPFRSLLLAAIGLVLGGRATAQSFMTLHSFTVPYFTGGEGIGSIGLILGANRLYGTIPDSRTFYFGWTVFALNTNGTGFTNLYS